MTAKREKRFHLDVSFEEALKRYIDVDPDELRKEWDQVNKEQGEIRGKIEETRRRIRAGARRTKNRDRV
jgi:hypothetical protein